jgi:aspartate-semialdehyde dehydrogenase
MTGYTVGIVGSSGAVGQELIKVLERRHSEGHLTVETLRLFGSPRSAGTTVESPVFGSLVVELFDVPAARQCQVVFLAVSGDFALEHAKKICEGEDGPVVIDNSVSD